MVNALSLHGIGLRNTSTGEKALQTGGDGKRERTEWKGKMW